MDFREQVEYQSEVKMSTASLDFLWMVSAW